MESCSKLPVTSLKIFNNLLLTGQGSKLVVYSLNSNKKLSSTKIFRSSRVHKICGENEKKLSTNFVILGGRSARCVRISFTDDKASVSVISKENIFKAWIWDGIWCSDDTILFISAHNTTFIWHPFSGKETLVSSCTQQCILYSATFGTVNSDTVVAAGTVFNQVLLWKPKLKDYIKEHSFVPIYKKFVGHEGVIFGIQFHSTCQQIMSVSDDRSIRLWSIQDETCMRVLYGHTARVWDARYCDTGIVSVGEDSVCLVWNLDGQVVKKYSGHKGKSIWSLDVSKNNIVTGGGDGGIRRWDTLEELVIRNGPSLELSIPTEADDFPRSIKLCGHDAIMTCTNEGVVWKYVLSSKTWTKIYDDKKFQSYCCFDISGDLVAMGNLDGVVVVFFIDNANILCIKKICSGKIFSLTWLLHNSAVFLLLTGPEGEIKLLAVKKTSTSVAIAIKATFSLPHSRQRWVSAASLVKYRNNSFVDEFLLVCGDRRGSLHLYEQSSQDPIQSILGVHGKTGVTRVISVDDCVYTTGRNGVYQKYEVDPIKIFMVLLDRQKACKGMDWIEGIWVNEDDVIVYGFYMQSYFAAWSNQSNELLFKIKCGGGYRSWDVLFPTDDFKILSFAYLKGAIINAVSCTWNTKSYGRTIQENLHGREVLCMKLLGYTSVENENHYLIATCSEDTTINFMLYNPDSLSLTCIHTVTGHIGGIKDIFFLPTSKQATNTLEGFFISCGSRTSLKVWFLKDYMVSSFVFAHGHSPLLRNRKTCMPDENQGDVQNGTKDVILQNEIQSTIHSERRNNDFQKENCSVDTFRNNITCGLVAEIFNPETTMKKVKLKNHDLVDDMRFLCCTAFMLSDVYSDMCTSSVVCCVCACSDGFARMYTFRNATFELLATLDFHEHCVQTVTHCNTTERCVVFTTATDGRIAIWDVTNVLREYLANLLERKVATSTSKDENVTTANHVNQNKFKFHDINTPVFTLTQPNCSIKVHQSGVNALDVFETSTGFLLLSGGDDNALYMCKIGCGLHEETKFSQIHAHISSISAVKIISDKLCVSTSIDQRIKFWKLTPSGFVLVREILSDVADISNMEIWSDRHWIYVGVTGIGIEIFKLSCEELI